MNFMTNVFLYISYFLFTLYYYNWIENLILHVSQKLLSILNILCNNTQTASIQSRDACYGCFFRAGGLPTGSSQLLQLSQCATLYLNNTNYAACAAQLQVNFICKIKKNTQKLIDITFY